MALRKVRAIFSFVILVYICSPVVFKYSPFIQRSLLFMNRVNQFNYNLTNPELLDLKCTRTLRLENHDDAEVALLKEKQKNNANQGAIVIDKIELGVWHITAGSSLPMCVTNHETNRTFIEDKQAFSGSRPIVLYIHGNGGTRAGNHRNQLYKRLAYEHDYHIVTFDYRGYGDSTYLQPTTDGLSADATFMYYWLLKQPNVTKERIVIWGHSLGTAVAVRMVADLPEAIRPAVVILEAPFDSVANAIANHPFSAPFRVIPYFEYFFIEPVEKSPDLNFDSVKRIPDIRTTPLMILHAEDDAIIPMKLGFNLYNEAKKTLGESKVKFISISANEGLGHKHICNHDETMTEVRKFVDRCLVVTEDKNHDK